MPTPAPECLTRACPSEGKADPAAPAHGNLRNDGGAVRELGERRGAELQSRGFREQSESREGGQEGT